MTLTPAMSTDGGQEDALMMPGFRFHPTEEELVDFYLRRKVEGRPFNVELITPLDLYSYDPWELPAMAAIGEKEWFFYVPRDRKYRNGNRPNRVTTSGYWKATGADRTIRGEGSSGPIGLKKTLVFYAGKAPKGVRTSWIMNEYRLHQSRTDQFHKAEISLCRVYKRTGVDDNYGVQPKLPSMKASSAKPSTFAAFEEEEGLSYNTVMGDNLRPVLRHCPNRDCLVSTCPLPPPPPPPPKAFTAVDGVLDRRLGCDSGYTQESGQMQHLQSSQNYHLLLHHLGLGSVPVSLSAVSESCGN